jgi:hypothetical protein
VGRRDPGHVDDVLHRDRHAEEGRQRVSTTLHPGVPGPRVLERPLGVDGYVIERAASCEAFLE